MRVATLALVLLLGSAAAASAKGPLRARVCGADACMTVSDPARVEPFVPRDPFFLLDAPRRAPYYRITITQPESQLRWTLLYVPSLRLVRVDLHSGGGAWWRAAPRSTIHALAPYARRLRPLRGRW